MDINLEKRVSDPIFESFSPGRQLDGYSGNRTSEKDLLNYYNVQYYGTLYVGS